MSLRRLLLSSFLLWGCGTSPSATTIDLPTTVAVSSEDFRGAVPCGDAPGAMKSFVATLTDLGTEDEPTSFTLPSSVVRSEDLGGRYGPVSCAQAAASSFVVAGHRYVAEVEAYDRTDLVALGAGSRTLVDAATGQYVAPRWTTSCGTGSAGQGPVTALLYRTRYVRGCSALQESYSSETAIRIVPAASLGALECGSEPGQIERFEATLLETNTPQSANCGEDLVFGALEADHAYHFELFGYGAGETFPGWGASCFRTAQSGAIVDAGCSALLSTGSLEVDTRAAVQALGLECGQPGGSGVSTLSGDLIATGNPKTVPCGATLRFDGLDPKIYGVFVSTTLADGSAGPKAVCDAVVLPGVARLASCRPE